MPSVLDLIKAIYLSVQICKNFYSIFHTLGEIGCYIYYPSKIKHKIKITEIYQEIEVSFIRLKL